MGPGIRYNSNRGEDQEGKNTKLALKKDVDAHSSNSRKRKDSRRTPPDAQKFSGSRREASSIGWVKGGKNRESGIG